MSGMDISEYKQLIVVPTLQVLAKARPQLGSAASINIMTGIALVESNLEYIAQYPTGPARSFNQVEPATHDDTYTTFLNMPANADLLAAVKSLLYLAHDDLTQLYTNPAYACAIARMKVYRAPPSLPAASDAAGMANYHKTWYNTAGGKANASLNTPMFQLAINA